jgi:hypothetical protein
MTLRSTIRRAVRGAKAWAIRLAFERGDMADTSSEVRLEEIGLGHPERTLYSPSSWLFLPRVMRSLEVRPSDVFVDFGSYSYFYYPFFGEIFRAVVAKIAASIDRSPRKVTIIFTDPKEVGGVRSTASEIVACLEATGRFELRRRHRVGLGRRNHSIAVYESRARPLAPEGRG